VFIELEKFKARNIRDKKLQVLWLRFLTEINEQSEKIAEELLASPEIQQAINFVYEASLTKEEKLLYDKNWDRISSEKTILSETHAAGIAKGRAEGEQLGIIKVALNARKKGMSIKDIAELTGLSEDEISKL
jgi:predicted transposase/invertase (TIGR01784 family)